MNYYLIRQGDRNVGIMICQGEQPAVPLHVPRTTSYFDDKQLIPVARKDFSRIRDQLESQEPGTVTGPPRVVFDASRCVTVVHPSVFDKVEFGLGEEKP